MAYEITAKELEDLSEDQQVAIMESLVLAVAADGKTSPAETQRFDVAINAVPWRMEPAKLIEHLLAVRTRIVGFPSGAQAAASLVPQVAERLPDPVLREKLFHAMASVMAVGGELSMDAKNMLAGYVRAFALTGGQIDAIKADIKAAQAPA